MLTFISDLHLCDGTTGKNIKAGAFKVIDDLHNMVKDSKAKEFELVLLGDIFEVISSTKWQATDVRPWSPACQKQEKVVLSILEDIFKEISKPNSDIVSKLRQVYQFPCQKNQITFMVGNHDWLVNRYESCRKLVCQKLSLAHDPKNLFAHDDEGKWGDYGVIARHGDIYDDINYEGNRDASSAGDAFVVELMDRFPQAVKNDLKGFPDRKVVNVLLDMLNDFDNVRPLWDVPGWIYWAARQTGSPDVVKVVKDCWEKLVKEFFEKEFIKEKGRKKKFAWLLPSGLMIRRGIRLVSRLAEIFTSGKYFKFLKTLGNDAGIMKDDSVRYFVCGHTHELKVTPLDMIKGVRKMHINTGTWRKHIYRMELDKEEFMSRYELTHVSFYKKDEKDAGSFEVWYGSLG